MPPLERRYSVSDYQGGLMKLTEELSNRGDCRYGLSGVLVSIEGVPGIIAIAHSFWNVQGDLGLELDNGMELSASLCDLASKWPVICCEPQVANEWNS